MRKLILGIIAVVLLQIAFFISYTSMNDTSSDINARTIRTDPVENLRELSRIDDPPTVAVPQVLPTIGSSQRPKPKPSVVTGRLVRDVRPHRDVRERTRSVRKRDPMPPITRAGSSRSVEQPNGARTQAGALIPKGYTMALIDYPSSNSYSIKTQEVALRTKKRSYLSRTLPALVKKPWRLMKSIASKFH